VNGRQWSARPVGAGLIRAFALLLPVVSSVGVVYAASQLVRPPTGSFVLYLGWWAALSGAATIVLAAVGRLTKRLLPLAALFKLSLVFPDGAPSRFRTAMRSGTVKTLEERLAEARRGHPDVTPAEAAQRLLVLVAALDDHDSLTRGHSERVRAYSQTIGRELGLKAHELDLLNWAALLHDVGKLEVPREILTKTGRPTDEEWTTLRRHPELGAALVAPLREWLGEWCDAVGEHHERWDGGGYPSGKAGTDISLAGRIVAVADVFDVITSSRSYKQASAASAGRAEIARCAGTQFDPEIVRAFLAISVGRARLATGPLAWLAQAPVLARIPLTSAAGTLSAAAVAVGAIAAPGLVVHHDSTPTPTSIATTAPVPVSVAGVEPFAGSRATAAVPQQSAANQTSRSGAAKAAVTTADGTTPPTTQPAVPGSSTPEPPGTVTSQPPGTVAPPDSGPAPTSSPDPEPSPDPLPVPSTDPLPVPSTDPLPVPSTDPLPVPSTDPLPVPSTDPLPVPSTDPLPVPSTDPLPVPSTDPLPVPSTDLLSVPS
jgi:putative nucleotidyltransferase with HDIG domain